MADVAAPPQAESLSELRARHLDLLERWTPDLEAEATAELVPLAEALRTAARSLGVWLDDPDDRDRAQGIIDYWTAALMGLSGYAFPEMMRLEPFDPTLPAAAAERAEAIVAPNDGTPREEDAETMLLALVRAGPSDRIVSRAPAERGDLVRAGASEAVQADQAALLGQLVEAGIIHRVASSLGDEDCYEFAHGSIARAWPRLRHWLDRRRNVQDTRERLKATAQLWRDSGDGGYLLTGDALAEAGKYLGEDPLLTEFIRVSRRAADRRRRQWLAVAAFILVASLGATATAFMVGNSTGFEQGNEQGFIEGNVVGFDKAVVKQEEVVEGDAPAPEAQATLDSEGRGLSGWIWAGSPDQPQLGDADTGRPVNPAELVVNRRYRATTNLWLRASQPDAAGEAGERASVVPRTGLVIVRQRLDPIERPSGPQYWVRVGVVPRVYLHHVNADRAQVERLRGALVVAGFEAPPAEASRNARRLYQVRYFRPEHREAATFLASRLAANFSRSDGSPVEFTCVRLKSLTSANLEIWLDFGALRISPPSRPAPPPQCP